MYLINRIEFTTLVRTNNNNNKKYSKHLTLTTIIYTHKNSLLIINHKIPLATFTYQYTAMTNKNIFYLFISLINDTSLHKIFITSNINKHLHT